jgi:hypothetical protein
MDLEVKNWFSPRKMAALSRALSRAPPSLLLARSFQRSFSVTRPVLFVATASAPAKNRWLENDELDQFVEAFKSSPGRTLAKALYFGTKRSSIFLGTYLYKALAALGGGINQHLPFFSIGLLVCILLAEPDWLEKLMSPDTDIYTKLKKNMEKKKLEPPSTLGERGSAYKAQQQEIKDVLENDNAMTCLMVLGPRGSGKSWTVEHALEEWKNKDLSSHNLIKFHPSAINSVEAFVQNLRNDLLGSSTPFSRTSLMFALNGISSQEPSSLSQVRSLVHALEQYCKEMKAKKQRVVFLLDDLEQIQGANQDVREAFKIILESLKHMARDLLIVPVFVNSDNQIDGELFPNNADGALQRIEMADMSDEESQAYLKINLGLGLTAEQLKAVRAIIGARVCDLRHLQRKLGKADPGKQHPFTVVEEKCNEMLRATIVDLRDVLFNTGLTTRGCTDDECLALLRAVLKAAPAGLPLGKQNPNARKFLISENVLAVDDKGLLRFTSKLQENAFKKLLLQK